MWLFYFLLALNKSTHANSFKLEDKSGILPILRISCIGMILIIPISRKMSSRGRGGRSVAYGLRRRYNLYSFHMHQIPMNRVSATTTPQPIAPCRNLSFKSFESFERFDALIAQIIVPVSAPRNTRSNTMYQIFILFHRNKIKLTIHLTIPYHPLGE